MLCFVCYGWIRFKHPFKNENSMANSFLLELAFRIMIFTQAATQHKCLDQGKMALKELSGSAYSGCVGGV